MTVLLNSLEGVTPSGTTISNANSGGVSGNALDVASIGVGSVLASDNAHAAHGGLGLKCSSAAATFSFGYWGTSLGAGQAQVWFRIYLYVTAQPAANNRVVTFWNTTSAGTLCGAVLTNTAGKIIMQNSGSTTILTSANSYPLNQWFRVEGFLLASATVGQLEFKLFNGLDDPTVLETQTSAATQNTGASVGSIGWGISNSPASAVGPLWLDDFGVSTTGYLGPAGTVPAAAPRSGRRPFPARGLARRITAGMLPGKGQMYPQPQHPWLRVPVRLVRRQPGSLRAGMLPGKGLSGIPPSSFLRSRTARVQARPQRLIPGAQVPSAAARPLVMHRPLVRRQPGRILAGMLPGSGQMYPQPAPARLTDRQPPAVSRHASRIVAGLLPPVAGQPVMAQQAVIHAGPRRLVRAPAQRLRTGMTPVAIPAPVIRVPVLTDRQAQAVPSRARNRLIPGPVVTAPAAVPLGARLVRPAVPRTLQRRQPGRLATGFLPGSGQMYPQPAPAWLRDRQPGAVPPRIRSLVRPGQKPPAAVIPPVVVRALRSPPGRPGRLRARLRPGIVVVPPPPVTYGTAGQGQLDIPAALAGQAAAARADAGTASLPAAAATAGQAPIEHADAGQMTLPHAEGGQ